MAVTVSAGSASRKGGRKLPDQRRVGHAIRRRMGAPSSHLGMAEQGASMAGAWTRPPSDDAALGQAEATARGNVQVPVAGGRVMKSSGRAKGVPPEYPTASPPPLGDNSHFVAGVAGGVQAEPHPPRAAMESHGARLTVSPSMKVPTESPVPTQGGGRPVPSTSSRQGSFGQGQQEMYGG